MYSTWTTGQVEPRARFAYWHDAICETILSVSPETVDSGRFSADLTSRQVGAIRLTSFRSTPHKIVRTLRHVSQSDEDSFLVSRQLVGRSKFSQSDGQILLEPGEIGIINGSRPFEADFLDDVARFVAVVPARMVYQRAPWLRGQSAAKIANASKHIGLMRAIFDTLATEEGDDAYRVTPLLIESLCNIIALSTRVGGLENEHHQRNAEFLERCIRSLGDPDLSPRRVASECRISVRTLHHRFSTMGTTFGRWVLENRLERCNSDLQNPLYLGDGISQIAFRWGFNDLSHFNKTFRHRYGDTPGSVRRRILTAGSSTQGDQRGIPGLPGSDEHPRCRRADLGRTRRRD